MNPMAPHSEAISGYSSDESDFSILEGYVSEEADYWPVLRLLDETLVKSVLVNKEAYQDRAKLITKIVVTVHDLLQSYSSVPIGNIGEIDDKISCLKKVNEEKEIEWSNDLEAYKFLRNHALSSKELLMREIDGLTQKAALYSRVADLFNEIYLDPKFKQSPADYIKDWSNEIDEKNQIERKKVKKRLDAVQPGFFSSPSFFYIRPLA